MRIAVLVSLIIVASGCYGPKRYSNHDPLLEECAARMQQAMEAREVGTPDSGQLWADTKRDCWNHTARR